MTDKLPAIVQISTLDRKISELSETLNRAVDDAGMASCIGRLTVSGLGMAENIDPDMAPEIYCYALGGSPAAALAKVTKKLIRGEYERGSEIGFMPKPSELARLVRAETLTMRADLRRLKETKESLTRIAEIETRKPRDEAMIARIRALTAKVRRADGGEAGVSHDH